MSEIYEYVSNAKLDPHFSKLNTRVEQLPVRTFSTVDECALLYSFASRTDVRTVVEIGAYCGGSTAFLAAGVRLRDQRQAVFAIDPFLDAPTWFPHGRMHSTFDEFSRNIAALDLTDQVVPMQSDSRSASAIWPARPIDLLFIDGDHSFLGVLSDFENWASKVSKGGHILIDDVDEIEDVRRFNAALSSFSGVRLLGSIAGMAVYRKEGNPSEFLASLRSWLSDQGIRRPWDFSGLAIRSVPDRFCRRDWPTREMHECYALAFFSVAEEGDYGISVLLSPDIQRVALCVSDDKDDGRCVFTPDSSMRPLRVCFCTTIDLEAQRSHLRPGTVIILETKDPSREIDTARNLFSRFGIEGFGHERRIFWGVYRPGSLSDTAIIGSHFRNAGLPSS